MKKIFFFLFCCLLLGARENPFESLSSPNTDTQLNNKRDDKIFENFDFKLPSTARILKEIKIVYQNIDGSLEEKTLNIDKNIDWHYPISLSQKDAIISKDSDYISANQIIFFTKENNLFITTNRKLQRNFILPEPFRIVIDFEKKDGDNDDSISINQKYFSSINLIKYKDFYRAIITLDGHYQYKISTSDDGYQITLQ
ncbi:MULTISPECIES: AMIN domain-containing protein [unclassified Helicobacter]|uniref:AMIN domain-containing protein n=1 Tax=unclassified Helicobacter TaxID=2593540 RepID=UPI000CF11955|nr:MULTISPECIES: AMIN domain-containing protein [unclassified Helicobacter]